MKVRLAILLPILVLANSSVSPQPRTPPVIPPESQPDKAHKPAGPSSPAQNANLNLARTYERLKQWSEAEKYFQEAAKVDDPASLEALLGIERVRAAAEAGSQEMAGGQYYKQADLPDKAEGEFVGALKSNSDSTRKSAQQALRELEMALSFQRRFDRWLQYAKYAAAALGVLSVLLLFLSYFRVSRSVEIGAFIEVGEKVQGRLPFWLALVRARIRALSTLPAAHISPLLPSPPILLAALPSFRDEISEPESEVEVGGAKLPLGSILNLCIKPKTKVTGGWTAPIAPVDGVAFATVLRRKRFLSHQPFDFVTRPIRATKAEEDLEVFAYDVYIKAAQAHAH